MAFVDSLQGPADWAFIQIDVSTLQRFNSGLGPQDLDPELASCFVSLAVVSGRLLVDGMP